VIHGDTLGDAGEQRAVVSSMGAVGLMEAIVSLKGAVVGLMGTIVGSLVGVLVSWEHWA
jgi:hypothetical protein